MRSDSPAMLMLDGVRFGFDDRPDFLGPITLSLRKRECWGIVGPNGAGKSTLLRLMAGLLTSPAGTIKLFGAPLSTMSPRMRARRIALVAHNPSFEVDFRVRDIVLMGRFPHRSMGLFESAGDYDIADRAMSVTQTYALADRPLATLSTGEAQRVHVAAALAQEPQLLLLDEPTASLDLQHQLGVFGILRDRVDADDLGVVVVTHDVNLAARFCSHVLVLAEGRLVAAGPPADTLTPELLGPVYGVDLMSLAPAEDPDCRWIVPAHLAERTRR